MLKKLLYLLLLLVVTLGLIAYIIKDNNKFKLIREIIDKPLPQVIEHYAALPCNRFNTAEKEQGYFYALVTGYCRPAANDFKVRHDFLCAVGLNCSCPAGREERLTCGNSGLAWAACREFDDRQTTYCNQTATLSHPAPGTIAADWSCFPPASQVLINGQPYVVADKGSAIKGRRLDLWFANCQDAFKAIGIYQVGIPAK